MHMVISTKISCEPIPIVCDGVGWGQCGVCEGTGYDLNIGRLVQEVFGLVVVWVFFFFGGGGGVCRVSVDPNVMSLTRYI